MNTDYQSIRAKLNPPVDRMAIIEIVSKGVNIPPMLRSASYVFINTMPQAELDRLAALTLKAVDYLEADDIKGLTEYLQACNIPIPIAGVIKQYAANFAEK